MGTNRYSYDTHTTTRAKSVASGKVAFDYSAKVKSGAISDGIHASLDPAYGGFRVSKQNVDGKKGKRITVALDVTGSNMNNAVIVHRTLPKLLGFLTAQGWGGEAGVDIQFVFVGDAHSDKYPLQISHFENDGAKLDSWLEKAILEGAGGGQASESYEIAMWAIANQNQVDERGLVFFFFDEMIYPQVSWRQLETIYTAKNKTTSDIPDSLKSVTTDVLTLPRENIPTQEVVNQLRAKNDVFCIMNGGTYYWDNAEHMEHWQNYFGVENVMRVENPEDNNAMMGAIIASMQGVKQTEIVAGILGAGLSTSKDLLVGNLGIMRGGHTNTMTAKW